MRDLLIVYPMQVNDKLRPDGIAIGRRRPGAVLVAVLVCVLIVMGLIAGAIRSTFTARRQCKIEIQLLQADRLLQAGIARIVVAKADDDLYRIALDASQLATWNAQAALPGYAIAEVSYQWLGDQGGSKPILRCTARLGVSSSAAHSVQLSRDLTVQDPRNISKQLLKPTNEGD